MVYKTYITNLCSFSQRVCRTSVSILCLASWSKSLMSESSKNFDNALRSGCVFLMSAIDVTSRLPTVWHKHVSLSDSWKYINRENMKNRMVVTWPNQSLSTMEEYNNHQSSSHITMVVVTRIFGSKTIFRDNEPYRNQSIRADRARTSRHKPMGFDCLRSALRDRCTNWRRSTAKQTQNENHLHERIIY